MATLYLTVTVDDDDVKGMEFYDLAGACVGITPPGGGWIDGTVGNDAEIILDEPKEPKDGEEDFQSEVES